MSHNDSTVASLDLSDPIVAVDDFNVASMLSDSRIILPADPIKSQHCYLDADFEVDLMTMTGTFVRPLSVVQAPDPGLGR